MVPRGLEPRTFRLLAERSDQLSYETSASFDLRQLRFFTISCLSGPIGFSTCSRQRAAGRAAGCGPALLSLGARAGLPPALERAVRRVLAQFAWRLHQRGSDAMLVDGILEMPLRHMTLAGLEPAIFGSEDQRLIH